MKDFPFKVESRKLALPFIVLFEVVRMVNPTAVHLKLPTAFTFHVSKVKPDAESALVPSEPPSSPILWIGALLTESRASWTSVAGDESSSSWEGYSQAVRSWFPCHFILDNNLLSDFYHTHPDKPGRTTRR